MECKVKKGHLKQNTRTQPLSIKNQKPNIKNPTNCWTIHGYISLTVILLPFLRHRIPLCCFSPHKFRVFCVAGMVLSMDLECSPRSSEALSAKSRSPYGEQLVTGGGWGGSTSSQAWGVEYHAGSYPVPGRIHFGIGVSLSDEGIRLRQSFGQSSLVYSRAIALGSSMYRKCLASKQHGLAVE